MTLQEKNMIRASQMKPSDWLTDRAKEIFLQVRGEMFNLGLLNTLDLPLIELLADTKARYEDITKDLRSQAFTVPCKRSGTKKNPAYQIHMQYLITYLEIAQKLGIHGKSKIIDPIDEERFKDQLAIE